MAHQERFMATLKVPITPEDHAQGPENAEVILVEYGDYECPHCGRAYPIVKQVQKHFKKRVRFVFRNFPLSEMHPHAEAAAEVAEFAGSQGKFWEMHDLLFENQARLGDALFTELGESLKLSTAALRQALEQKTFEARVRADFSGGVRSGVNGTPTFFINGRRHDDSFDYDTLVSAIRAVLDTAKSA
jgi:protein-disulfide isomerase